MDLFFRKFGKGQAFIIIHGLYGCSDNWVNIGKQLSEHFEVFIIDQRNHGQSPHSIEHNYNVLKTDLKEFIDKHSLKNIILLGHSMGGKTAMFFAAEYPQYIDKLIVVDISPRSYNKTKSTLLAHKIIIKAMYDIDFHNIKSRNEVDLILSKSLPDIRLRKFLLKNIKRSENNELSWKLNIKTLKNELDNIVEGFDKNHTEIKGFPILFIKGAKSDYIKKKDKAFIFKIFPFAQIITIENAGHWIHVEQTDTFIKAIINFTTD
ncbi:MAG: alpha/beta fold hydrolase [Bacteroidales bacterium]|nr:alpha/beta fold hydrolase [Bacteroidales bacterium]